MRGSEPMPDSLNAALRAATRRIRALMLLRYGSRAVCWSALLCLILVGLGKLRVFATPDPWLVGGIVGAALLGAIIYTFVRKLTELDVAKMTERRTDLKERLSSAVEFHNQGYTASEPFYGEQLTDAARHASGLNLKAAYPVRMPLEFWGGLIGSLALFGMYFLPTLPVFWSKERRQEAEEVKLNGIAIVKVAQDAQKAADKQNLTETKKAAEEARKLGEAMQKSKMTKKESLVALQKLTKKMEETQKKMAESQQRSMQKAATDFKKSLDQMQKEVAEKQQEEAKRKAEEAKTNPQKPGDKNNANAQDKPQQQQQQKSEAMKKTEQALQQMAQALADMDQQQQQQAMEKIAQQMESGQMTKEEMKQLQKALQELSKALKDSGQKDAAQQMEQMAQQMEQGMGNMDPKTLQQMAQAARNMGQKMGKGSGNSKDKIDQQTMQQLADSLKNGRMTMALSKMPGQGGNMPGTGFNGKGHETSAMKDPDKTDPRMVAEGKNEHGKGVGKNGKAEEFAKYLAMKSKAPDHLPNGKIKGDRSKDGNELQINMTGDPEPFKSNSPYYQVYQTSKKQAENTLNKENIPATYKKQVKDYFDSIKP